MTVLAIPCGIALGVKLGWGLHGLWAGLAFALTIAGSVELVLVCFLDWRRLRVGVTENEGLDDTES